MSGLNKIKQHPPENVVNIGGSRASPANFKVPNLKNSTAAPIDDSPSSAKVSGSEDNAATATSNNVVPSKTENPKPLNQGSFPDQSRDGSRQTTATIANLVYMLNAYGITARYNIIRKKMFITIPGVSGTPDNADNVAIAHIISLANLNAMPVGHILSFLEVIADENQFNPVADWIASKPWDGVNRLTDFYATLVHRADYPEHLKQALMYRWLISAVAAALKPSGFKARGVLTLQGPQLIGKTSWISSLVSDSVLNETVLKLDHHLDAGNKDSLITAVAHWIVEIGELDSSFKKDIARLKGFLTADRDKVRRPYGKTDSEYPRRTVFCATVNDHDFLVDSTGNSRWWTIPVTAVNYNHGIDMQQLFAQLAVDFANGIQWWLTPDEDALLEFQNKDHRVTSVIRERILEALDLDLIGENGLSACTPTQVLQSIGIQNPTNPQCKECTAILRELLGESKRIKGQDKWRIPFKLDKKCLPLSADKFINPDDY